MIDFTPRMHPNDIKKRLRDAVARGVYEKAVQDARDIEPNEPWPPYSPDNPMNNVDPQHEVGVGAVVYFGMPGHLGTPLQEISFIQNAIPRSDYPLDITTIYSGMSRELTPEEVAYLNTAAGYTP